MVGSKLTARAQGQNTLLPRIDTAIATDSCTQDNQITAPGQASTVVSRPKIFGESSRVRVMHENDVDS